MPTLEYEGQAEGGVERVEVSLGKTGFGDGVFVQQVGKALHHADVGDKPAVDGVTHVEYASQFHARRRQGVLALVLFAGLFCLLGDFR